MPRLDRLAAAGAAAFGFGWFVHLAGFRALDPRALDFVLQGDWAQSTLGWLFFRGAPWRLPLGDLPELVAPVGSSLVYQDGIPWLALTARLLGAGLAGPTQLIGPWLALCFALQGWFGARLVSRFSRHPLHQLLGGALFTLAPVLTWRVFHASLCAQWTLLALLFLYFGPAAPKRALAPLLGVVLLTAGLHPYLLAMALGLALATLLAWRLAAALSTAQLGMAALALIVSSLLVLLLFGAIGRGVPSEASGFGWYAADLLTFWSPLDRANLLPARPASGGAYEGFGYLGAGALGLLLAALLLWARVRTRPPRELLPLAAVCLCAALFAFSSELRIGGRRVLTLDYGWLGPLPDAFRASGRFVWPAHYALLLLAVALTVRRLRPAAASALLGLALLVQLIDHRPAAVRDAFRNSRYQPLTDPAWLLAAGDYDVLRLIPPLVVDGSGRGCPAGSWERDEYVPFGVRAAELGLRFNSGYPTRIDAERAKQACEEQVARFTSGALEPRSLYVVRSDLHASIPPAAACGELDGHRVCVAAQSETAFAARLRTP